MPDDSLTIAQKCAEIMGANDPCVDTLGVTVHPITVAGQASCSMVVDGSKANGHGIGFGGFIFSLADIAFAYGCNAHDNVTVAQHCSITFVRPAMVGDTLTATAVERTRGKRSGIYDITVTNQDDKFIAEFRGHSTSLGQPLIP